MGIEPKLNSGGIPPELKLTKPIPMRISYRQRELLDSRAAELGVPRSTVLREALDLGLEALPKTMDPQSRGYFMGLREALSDAMKAQMNTPKSNVFKEKVDSIIRVLTGENKK